MCFNIYVQKDKTNQQARKKGIKILTLSKMNNQKAHTEADKEEGDSLQAKCLHLRLTNNKDFIISY